MAELDLDLASIHWEHEGECWACEETYPCAVVRLLAENARLRAVAEAARAYVAYDAGDEGDDEALYVALQMALAALEEQDG